MINICPLRWTSFFFSIMILACLYKKNLQAFLLNRFLCAFQIFTAFVWFSWFLNLPPAVFFGSFAKLAILPSTFHKHLRFVEKGLGSFSKACGSRKWFSQAAPWRIISWWPNDLAMIWGNGPWGLGWLGGWTFFSPKTFDCCFFCWLPLK